MLLAQILHMEESVNLPPKPKISPPKTEILPPKTEISPPKSEIPGKTYTRDEINDIELQLHKIRGQIATNEKYLKTKASTLPGEFFMRF